MNCLSLGVLLCLLGIPAMALKIVMVAEEGDDMSPLFQKSVMEEDEDVSVEVITVKRYNETEARRECKYEKKQREKEIINET
ncbi:hypothetical protein M8J76_012368 [Diaphorina citri]|nr:hypothetical protein M8J75_000955 [Diaphorina citri]KAI5733474.1 hypothetical protein M8J76_012368 [Diaphorina citri]KAI5739716.1 hypothetical protein M8J77_022542 [Diaphorina citri]